MGRLAVHQVTATLLPHEREYDYLKPILLAFGHHRRRLSIQEADRLADQLHEAVFSACHGGQPRDDRRP